MALVGRKGGISHLDFYFMEVKIYIIMEKKT